MRGFAVVAGHASRSPKLIHPLHAILLAFPLPMFSAALLADIAYWRTFQAQWANFAAWVIAAGLFAGTFVVLWALSSLIRGSTARRRDVGWYLAVLVAMWIVGFINSLVHAKDAFATMPEGLFLSAATAILALIASWVGYSGFHPKETA